MRLDPVVEERKFRAEVATLRRNASVLSKMGALVVRAEKPEIDVLLIPDKPLRLAVVLPAASPQPQIDGPQQGALLPVMEYPGLSGKAFGVRLDLAGYDQCPPSVSFRNPRTWEPAPFATLPIAHIVEEGKL